MRPWPRSLLGQTLLAVALALLIAQAVSAALLWQAAQNRREVGALHAAAFRLLARDEHYRSATDGMPVRSIGEHHGSLPPEMRMRIPRVLGVETSDRLPFAAGSDRQERLEAIFAEILADQGSQAADLAIVRRPAASDPVARRIAARRAEQGRRTRWIDADILVVALRTQGDGPWRIARVPIPNAEPRAIGSLALQTLVIFIVLFAIMAIMLRRITRPLGALTRQTEQFAETGTAIAPLVPEGPHDVRRLIAAHNAMETRIARMLDEKDVMLGAIGHDLKTPLAALRVRIEGIEDEDKRARMAGTIEEIALTLDDILSLARIGRNHSPPEQTDLVALCASVVEECEDLGQDVTLDAGQRIVAPVHPTWLKRALRNLASNAVRYGGGAARVALASEPDAIVLSVEDSGPGIPEDRIEAMMEPFQRGEASRNRATGGAGLGLTLARAIAEQHGGRLVLANRTEGGLRAELRLPLESRSARL